MTNEAVSFVQERTPKGRIRYKLVIHREQGTPIEFTFTLSWLLYSLLVCGKYTGSKLVDTPGQANRLAQNLAQHVSSPLKSSASEKSSTPSNYPGDERAPPGFYDYF